MRGFVPSTTLAAYLDSSDEQDREKMHEYIFEMATIIAKSKPGNARMSQLYLKMDELIKNEPNLQTHEASCGLGCTACCHQHVSCTMEEAKKALSIAIKNGSLDLIMRDKIEAQVGLDSDQHWELPWEQSTCPFLNERSNSCLVYEGRPLACRCLYVQSDPDLCIKGHGDGLVQRIVCVNGELVSAAYTAVVVEEGSMDVYRGLADHLHDLLKQIPTEEGRTNG